MKNRSLLGKSRIKRGSSELKEDKELLMPVSAGMSLCCTFKTG